MDFKYRMTVLDALDIDAEAAFWAGLLDGSVESTEGGRWRNVWIDSNWQLGVQQADEYTPPTWPDPATPQRSTSTSMSRASMRSILSRQRSWSLVDECGGRHPTANGRAVARSLRRLLGIRSVCAGCRRSRARAEARLSGIWLLVSVGR